MKTEQEVYEERRMAEWRAGRDAQEIRNAALSGESGTGGQSSMQSESEIARLAVAMVQTRRAWKAVAWNCERMAEEKPDPNDDDNWDEDGNFAHKSCEQAFRMESTWCAGCALRVKLRREATNAWRALQRAIPRTV